MATFKIRDGQLALEFSPLEKLGGLRSGATVGLKDIQAVEKVDDPWDILDGLRLGTGSPWVIVLGTMLLSRMCAKVRTVLFLPRRVLLTTVVSDRRDFPDYGGDGPRRSAAIAGRTRHG
jgi:hypothetical protein